MLKGPYTAICLSVVVHLIILFALTYSAIKQPKAIKQDKPKLSAIKSFLYTAPKKTVNKKSPTKLNNNEPEPPPKVEPTQAILKKPASTDQVKAAAKVLPNKPITKAQPIQVTNAVSSKTVTTENKVTGTSRGGFSSYDSLSRLRNRLDNQQRDQAFTELTQKRSSSMMHGEPFPVPKTIVPLTVEQQKKLNTSTSHVGSITKNDNGTCTIYREQMLGSPVEATTAYFACGESKFDKSFREHMKKVQAKLRK